MLRLFIAYLLPGIAFANETVAPGVSSGSYLQAALALGLIVLLLVGTAWFARKISGGKGFGQGGMKIVGGVTLGPRERMVMVEVGDSWLIIGIVPGQIRTLHTMPRGHLANQDPATNTMPFAQWLKTISARRQDD